MTVLQTAETHTSCLLLGTRGHDPVVLKVIKRQGDEWHSGGILQAFAGRGVVRVYEQVEGAVLLERAVPAESLVRLALEGRDDEATAILAGIIQQMAGCVPPHECATVGDWAKGFEWYLTTGDQQISRGLVEDAFLCYTDLAASQRSTRLLHGDLHHYNVLSDARRGWLAIDPKGLIGEVEYEIGAMIRNPLEYPAFFTARGTIETRLSRFSRTLNLNTERALRWAFAQAVLSAVWDAEDGRTVDANSAPIRLAITLRDMVDFSSSQ